MQNSYPSTYGPSRPSSRRRSPISLDPASFSTGAAQTLGWPYDSIRNSTMTATANEQYQSATQYGYPYYPRAADPSHHTQTAASSSAYQNCNIYNAHVQPHQQASTSYQSAPTADWNSSSYYDSSTQPSVNGASDSAPQHVTPPSSGTSQLAPSASHTSSEKRIKPSKPIASTSRRPKDSNPDMDNKMGRWRLGKNVPAQPASQLCAASDLKRKDRAMSPTETANAAEASTNKKAKPATADAGTSQGAQRAKKHRDKLNHVIAELATRLPQHLQLFEDKPSVANIRQAIIHIDELENEVAQLRGAHIACQQEIYRLESASYDNRQQIHALRSDLGVKDARIGELEKEVQTSRYSHPRHV